MAIVTNGPEKENAREETIAESVMRTLRKELALIVHAKTNRSDDDLQLPKGSPSQETAKVPGEADHLQEKKTNLLATNSRKVSVTKEKNAPFGTLHHVTTLRKENVPKDRMRLCTRRHSNSW